MKKTSITVIITFLFLLASSAQSADENNNREIWLTAQSLSGGIGFQYKTSLKNNTYFRLGVLDLHASQSNYLPTRTSRYDRHRWMGSAQIQIGIEKRKGLSDKTSFIYGLNLVEDYNLTREKIDDPNLSIAERTTSSYNLRSGVGVPLGVLINLKGKVFFAAEVQPSIAYLYSISDKTQETYDSKTTGIDIDLNLASTRISLVFRL